MFLRRFEKTLLFLTVLFLPTQLGKHFWPDFSFVYSLKIDYLSPTVYFWDLMVLVLVSIKVITGIKSINWTALNLLLFFLLTQIISLFPLTSYGIGAGFVRSEQYLVCGLFGVYIASLNLGRVKKIIFWALVFSVFIESTLALGQFLKNQTLGFWIFGERTFSISTPGIAKFDFYSNQLLRPYATFPHPNVLAAFLVITIILLYFFRQKERIYLSATTVILGITTLVLTVSRTAIVASFFISFFILRRKWVIWISLPVLLAALFLYPRFSSTLSFDSLTVLRREELSKLALHLWLSRPIFGVGLNNFIISSSENLIIGPSRFLQPVHNIFLLSLSETGIIGFLSMLCVLGYPIYKLIKLQFPVSLLREASRFQILLLCWGVIIFLGMFDHYFLTLPQGLRILFLVWGISISVLELKNEKYP